MPLPREACVPLPRNQSRVRRLRALFCSITLGGIFCGHAAELARDVSPLDGRSWTIRFNTPAAQQAFIASAAGNELACETRAVAAQTEDLWALYHLKLAAPIAVLEFDYAVQGDAAQMPLVLLDAAANELWRHDDSQSAASHVRLEGLRARGQLVFRVLRPKSAPIADGAAYRVTNLKFISDSRSPNIAPDGFVLVDSLDELRGYANQSGVKVRLKPGTYQLDRAFSRHFIEFTGDDSRWDLRGVTLRIDTHLFRQFGAGPEGIYCVTALAGDRIEFEGLKTENYGDQAGIQSRNKIFNITGSGVVLRNVDITTSGSSPWGYGSLYGISGGDVRKMNGIRVGAPAKDVKLIGCRVHMRAMGHAIFVQGAHDTRIENCHVDGLLRPTNEILAEKSGYAFDRKFTTRGSDYIEGVSVGPHGKILPDEMIALSEDGIRIYEQFGGQPTGSATIVDCTVTRMRRGICVGLGPSADKVINCEARDCVAVGFNVGSGDTLENCRSDAKYAEALCLPYMDSHHADVELEILDSRGGLANDLLAIINGQNHRVALRSASPEFVPANMSVELASRRGYAFYQRTGPISKNHRLTNETRARVLLNPNAADNQVTSQGGVAHRSN